MAEINLREIVFLNVKPKTVQRAVFHVKHSNGNRAKIKVSKTELWLEVASGCYSRKSGELIFKVKAKGEEAGKIYKDIIRLKINGKNFKIRVKLTTKKKRKTAPTAVVPPVKKNEKSAWRIAPLIILLLIAGGLALPSKISYLDDGGKPPESLDKWIESTLVPSLDPKPNGWYDYWYSDWVGGGDDIWAVGGITFTAKDQFFKNINFVFHSPDRGKSWQVSWRTDLQEYTWFFRTEKISIKSGRVEVLLWGQFNNIITIQTTDRGKTWTIK